MSSTFDENRPFSEAGSSRTITAFFDSRDDAQRALDRLDGLGLPSGSAKLVRGNDATVSNGDNETRGFWESLSDFFFPDDDRATYAEGLRRGGFLVTASNIPADKYDEALDILDDEGSVDVDARSSEWRSEGWNGSSYGDGKPFERADRSDTSAAGLSMASTGVAASAFTGDRLAGGASGYDADRDLSTAQTGTDMGTSGSAASRIAASSDRDIEDRDAGGTDIGGVGGPAMRDRDEEGVVVASGSTGTAAIVDAGGISGGAARQARRDLDTGRMRARSYSFGAIDEEIDRAAATEVEIEDDRDIGRGEGTSGRQVDAGTRR